MSKADFKLVETQAIELHERWMTYSSLFGSDVHRDLLNDSGATLFSLTAELYREGILSSLFRLTDRRNTLGNTNVTVRILPDMCPQVRGDLETQIEELDKLLEPLKELRHKRVGHTDLEIARRSGVQAVPELREEAMEDVLGRVRSIINAARSNIEGSSVDFDYEVDTVNAVDYLIKALEWARQRLGKR